MKLLLDTHTFLWFISGSSKLSSLARTLIEEVNNDKCLSIASLWETAIKLSLGKLSLAKPFDILIPEQMKLNGFELINIEMKHITVVSTMPMHHRDPFDRILAAQCIVESISIISSDTVFDSYSIQRLW